MFNSFVSWDVGIPKVGPHGQCARKRRDTGNMTCFIFNSTRLFKSPDKKLGLMLFFSLFPHFQMKAMLHRYYSAVKPEKAADIDKMVSNYLGRQTVLHRRLKKKYGVDPRDFRK